MMIIVIGELALGQQIANKTSYEFASLTVNFVLPFQVTQSYVCFSALPVDVFCE